MLMTQDDNQEVENEKETSNNEILHSNEQWYDTKAILALVLAIVLHLTFSGENYLLNYWQNTSPSGALSGQRNWGHLLQATWGSFLYSCGGMIFSVVFISPFVYRKLGKGRKKLFKSISYGLLIGVIFRIISYMPIFS